MPWLTSWQFQWVLVPIALAGQLYALGGRASVTPGTVVKRSRGAAFYLGLVALVLAIASPIDAYADRLFWVHMIQHVLLTMVAPPLLLLGRPWPRIARPLPPAGRRPLARAVLAGPTLAPARAALGRLASPLPAFVLFNATFLIWHLPALYGLSLRSGSAHDLEHALFFGTAVLFWTHLVPGSRPRLDAGRRVAYGTAALLVGWALAVVIGLATHPLYGGYASLGSRPGGLSALADQQLAAGIMWVPGSVPLTIALLYAAYRWLEPADARARRRPAAQDLRPRET